MVAIKIRPWGFGVVVALTLVSISVLTDATVYEMLTLSALWSFMLIAAVVEHRRTEMLYQAEQSASVQLLESMRRLELERARLSAKNEELAAANRRLEEFTAAAAHQLKSGPRMVRGLVEALRDDCEATGIPPKCDPVLCMIDDRARDMLEVVSAIQEMGRLHVTPVSTRPELLSVLVRAAISKVSRIRTGEARVSIPEDWRVLTCASLLNEALFNIIDNAWKFNRESPPRIEVSAVRVGDLIEMTLEDNGIGLSPDTPHLYEMFRRHTSAFPGTGVGLAAAARMVEKAGGELTLLPNVGKGAKFQIVLHSA